jgi:hypothetical protein
MAFTFVIVSISALGGMFSLAWCLNSQIRRRIEAPKYRPLKWR